MARIVATTERLEARVGARFPERGIHQLSRSLTTLARSTESTIARVQRPDWRLRAASGAAVAIGLAVLLLSATQVSLDSEISGLDEWLSVAQAGIQDVVFVGIAVAFLVSLDRRRQRRRALVALHELRSVAHVIDMHQLTKDPDATMHPEQRTARSPTRDLDRRELTRYLDYCSEMLSITGKLAALYAQESTDGTVLDAVREIENLTSTLSNKIWQKIMILDLQDAP